MTVAQLSVASIIYTAVGNIIASAWQNSLETFIGKFYNDNDNDENLYMLYQFLYAIIITLIAAAFIFIYNKVMLNKSKFKFIN